MNCLTRVSAVVALLIPFGLQQMANAADAVQVSASATAASSSHETLVGTWRLATSAISDANAAAADGINTRLKIYNASHWVLVQPNPDSGAIEFVHGGTYRLEEDRLREEIKFAGEATRELIGTVFNFRIVFSEGSYEQIDPKGVFSENWSRVETAE